MSRVSAQQVFGLTWAPKQSIRWTYLWDCVAFNLSYPAATTQDCCIDREPTSRFYCLLYKRIHMGGGTFQTLGDSQVGTPIRYSPVVRMFVRPSTGSIFSCFKHTKSIKLLFFQRVCWHVLLWLTNGIILIWAETAVKLVWNWWTDSAFVVKNQMRLCKSACLREAS